MQLKILQKIFLFDLKVNSLFLVVAVIFALSNSPSASAQIDGGGYTDSYLLRDAGARAIGMAGAFSAIANDPSTIFYNPSGLVNLSNKPNFVTQVSPMEFGRCHSLIAWGQNFFDNFGFGLAFNNYTSGSFIKRDEKGNPLGTCTDWQYSFSASAAYAMDFANVGVTLKYLGNRLTGSSIASSGFAVDIGTKFNVMNMFSFALTMQNISGISFWNKQSGGEDDVLPFTIRSGVAMEFPLNETSYETRSTVTGDEETINVPATRYVTLGVDAVYTQYEKGPTFVLGVEAVPHEIIAFRGGLALFGPDMGTYKILPWTKWGGGVSIRPPMDNLQLPFKASFDYSVSSDLLSNSQIAHHFSLVIEF